MMLKRRYLHAGAVLLLLLWSAVGVQADSGADKALSLQQCIETAMLNQDDLLIGGNTIIAAKEKQKRVLSDYYPRLTTQYTTDLVESGSLNTGQKDGLSVSVSHDFYDGGLRAANARVAAAGLSQELSGLDRTRQTVVYDVTKGYFSLLQAQRLAEVQRTRVKYLEGQLAMVRTRVQLGAAAQVDALPIEAQLSNARVDLLEAESTIRTSAIQLQNTMGLSPGADFSVQETGEPVIAAVGPVEDYVTAALSGRPDLREVEAGVKSAAAAVDAAKVSLRPRPVVSGSYDKAFDGDDDLRITGGITFDLFDGGSNRAAYNEEVANRSSAELRVAKVKKSVQSEVRQAYLNLTSAKERMAAGDLSLKAAQKNFEAQEGRYKQGLAVPLDLLNAQVEVVTAQSNAVQARYDYYTSVAQLEYAIGKPGGLYEKAD
ncbi:MAG: TolC family protein [bacterium]|nr:TolC family protein [bacterium]